ncbi:MAG: hypothetical protein Q8899_01840 [Weeping tea tree witches'-broom phytoplasma]|uniref:hypothetical protein n=1 Tax=Candidatus Phytoplasma melaleucae TaxID=2982630 RepID=UPI002939E6E4|nr:hypothetical protein [Weeping tea tree witches'-broom phytoplasma]
MYLFNYKKSKKFLFIYIITIMIMILSIFFYIKFYFKTNKEVRSQTYQQIKSEKKLKKIIKNDKDEIKTEEIDKKISNLLENTDYKSKENILSDVKEINNFHQELMLQVETQKSKFQTELKKLEFEQRKMQYQTQKITNDLLSQGKALCSSVAFRELKNQEMQLKQKINAYKNQIRELIRRSPEEKSSNDIDIDSNTQQIIGSLVKQR